MSTIFRCKFGSYLYGTNLPTSDEDYKTIEFPDARSILLQRVKNSRNNSSRPEGLHKNRPGDVEEEFFSLQQWLKLLCEGQTVAIDMLFAPKEFILEKNDIVWGEIVANKHKLLHSGTSAFVGYTRAQAAKYGVKGFRVAAVKLAMDWFGKQAGGLKLNSIEPELFDFVVGSNNEYINIVEIEGAQGKKEIALEVCDRKIPYHATVNYTHEVLSKIYDNYGTRAKLAQSNEGIDWKALMHAVRVAREAEELLLTQNVTFPRPEKELLLQIRKQELPYAKVAEIIEEGLVRVEQAKVVSTLRTEPDRGWVDDFVANFYKKIVENA